MRAPQPVHDVVMTLLLSAGVGVGAVDAPPLVHDFVADMGCRAEGHAGVPHALRQPGLGKVVVDIGLDDGAEFFTAISNNYSVYGFEANPHTLFRLKKRCARMGAERCEYVHPGDGSFPLPPKRAGGYLIGAGAGAMDGLFNFSLAGAQTSMVDEPLRGAQQGVASVRVLPLGAVVQADVYFLKIDVQGAEFEVLKGARELFEKFTVKTLLMELYPRGLLSAGVDMLQFMRFIYDELGMFCSTSGATSRNRGFEQHPNSLEDFAAMLQRQPRRPRFNWGWGRFDDLMCFNARKAWNSKNSPRVTRARGKSR